MTESQMNERILIIDDDQTDRKMMKKFLEKAGFGIISMADSGEKGLEVARTEKPQVVIVDTLLPGMDGHETCRRIKELGPEDLKIIATTGAVDAVDAGRARKAGADDYVVKTIDYAYVVEAVQKVVKGTP